ncbi:hypothetical protein BGY98DRAFT_932374 [Russula aff. rugulosa BPL654]|nr:hypothetical protein BGY98DRAFT_932374 [Russula aff. rugulosa BPL654]
MAMREGTAVTRGIVWPLSAGGALTALGINNQIIVDDSSLLLVSRHLGGDLHMVSWFTTTSFTNKKLPHILRLDTPCGPAVVALSGRSVHYGTAGEREAVRIRSKG